MAKRYILGSNVTPNAIPSTGISILLRNYGLSMTKSIHYGNNWYSCLDENGAPIGFFMLNPPSESTDADYDATAKSKYDGINNHKNGNSVADSNGALGSKYTSSPSKSYIDFSYRGGAGGDQFQNSDILSTLIYPPSNLEDKRYILNSEVPSWVIHDTTNKDAKALALFTSETVPTVTRFAIVIEPITTNLETYLGFKNETFDVTSGEKANTPSPWWLSIFGHFNFYFKIANSASIANSSDVTADALKTYTKFNGTTVQNVTTFFYMMRKNLMYEMYGGFSSKPKIEADTNALSLKTYAYKKGTVQNYTVDWEPLTNADAGHYYYKVTIKKATDSSSVNISGLKSFFSGNLMGVYIDPGTSNIMPYMPKKAWECEISTVTTFTADKTYKVVNGAVQPNSKAISGGDISESGKVIYLRYKKTVLGYATQTKAVLKIGTKTFTAAKDNTYSVTYVQAK